MNLFFVQVHKKGEVVGPAGGETGVPRCLAEDYKLQIAALFHHFVKILKSLTFFQKAVKQKNITIPLFRGNTSAQIT